MWKTLKKYRYPYLFICPFFILFLVFQLIPTIWTIRISFVDWNGLKAMKPVGWANYRLMFNDYMFKDSIRNTAIYWIVSVIAIMILSVMLATMLNSHLLRSRRFFKTATFLPYVCAGIAVGLIFGMLFEENAGLVNGIIKSLGGKGIPWLTSSKYARIPVEILFVWRHTPWFTQIVFSGLLNIPEEYYEAAKIDGASSIQRFIRITLPLLSNILFFCFVTITVDSWKLFNESYVLAGPGSSNSSLFQLMYTTAFRTFKLGYGAALSCVLILVLLLISFAQFFARRRMGEI